MKYKIATLILSLSFTSSTLAGHYTGKTITKIQAEGPGEPYNVIYINPDSSDETSPCSSSNSKKRFTLTSEFQKSVALAAMLAGSTIDIHTDGVCSSDIEGINHIVIHAN